MVCCCLPFVACCLLLRVLCCLIVDVSCCCVECLFYVGWLVCVVRRLSFVVCLLFLCLMWFVACRLL